MTFKQGIPALAPEAQVAWVNGRVDELQARLAELERELEAKKESIEAAWELQQAAEARVEKMALAISDALGRYQVTHIHAGLREAMKDMP